jgi:hypothetical protein
VLLSLPLASVGALMGTSRSCLAALWADGDLWAALWLQRFASPLPSLGALAADHCGPTRRLALKPGSGSESFGGGGGGPSGGGSGSGGSGGGSGGSGGGGGWGRGSRQWVWVGARAAVAQAALCRAAAAQVAPCLALSSWAFALRKVTEAAPNEARARDPSRLF